jgi:hypothetical protein
VARFQVGEAFLQVKPSLKGLHREISDEVKRWDDLEVNVSANMERFHRELSSAVSKIDAIEVDVEPNTSRFRERAVAGIGSMNVEADVVANTARARVEIGAFATQMQQRLEAATRSLGDIRIDGDAGPAERKIASLRAQLATLQNQRIGLDIDADEAIRKITSIQAQLTALSSRTADVRVRVDTGAAIAELAAFNTAVSHAGREGNFLTRAVQGIGSAIGSVLPSVGSMVSNLANLAGEGTRVGGAISSMSSFVSNASSQFGGFAGSIGTAVVSMAAFVPIVLAVAAAGSVAVAGIAQLGGAVIALASGIVPLTGLLGTLPGLIAPIGLAVGALAIAFGDEGLKKEVEGLKQSFQPLINDVRNQLRPAFTEMINTVEGLVPLFQRVAPVITSALSDVTRGFAAILRETTFQQDLETILTAAGNNIREFGAIGQSVFRAFVDIVVAAQPAVNTLIAYIRQGATEFQTFIAEARRTGELAAFFQQAVDVLISLLGVVRNVAGLFVDLWESANRTGAFMAVLEALNAGVSRFRDYVSQAGGAWDQLMARAGAVTTSLVGLAASVGQAFTEMGAKVDITPLIDKLSQAITRVTPAFTAIAQAAVPALTQIVEVVTQLVERFGPQTAALITGFGNAFTTMAPAITGAIDLILRFVAGGLQLVEIVGNAASTLVSLGTAARQVFTGDFAGAAQTISDMNARTTQSIERVRALESAFQGGGTSATALGTAITGVPGAKDVQFSTNAAAVLVDVNAARTGIQSVPQTWLTRFGGDIVNIAAAAGQAANSIGSVVPSHVTAFTGDTGNILSQAGAATGGINAVPGQHHTPFTGDPSGAVGAAGTATGAINGIPRPGPIQINAQDNASPVISQIIAKLTALTARVWTAVVNAAGGVAAGGILAPMASGGVLGMAPGDNLTPMRGGTARMVPPNTWRVIGDRMRDIEAYIPVNNSVRSQAILNRTAALMGKAIVPRTLLPVLEMLSPVLALARGRVLMTDDAGRPIAFADEPAIPTSTPYKQGRPQRGRQDFKLFDLISHLFRSLLLPQLRSFGERLGTAGGTMAEQWQRQAVTIASTIQGLQGAGRGQTGPPPEWLGGPSRGTATPTGWLPPGADSIYSPPGQRPPWWAMKGTAGATPTAEAPVVNVYPQPQQSEEAIASIVARRQAFALRS